MSTSQQIPWTHQDTVPGLDPADLPFAAMAFERDAVEREHRDLRAVAASDPGTTVLVMAEGKTPVRDGRLVLSPVAQAPEVSADPAHPEVYLGRLAGTGPMVVLRSYPPGTEPVVAGAAWAGLRELGTCLSPEETSLLVTAQAVGLWHRDHPRCPRCGEITGVTRSGWTRRCPRDETQHFPRTDPAVIMAVTDGHPDPQRERLLLGRSALWRENRYSTLAGFVEPGESAEQAVAREIFEEAGIAISAVDYQGSQPWPFPRSLMLGFRAVAGGTDPVPDGREILDLQWFTRAQLKAAALQETIVLPGPISIAHALIVSWLGEPLPKAHGAS